MVFAAVLTAILAALKLLGILAWPWLWVLCPLWLAALAGLAVFALVLLAERIRTGTW